MSEMPYSPIERDRPLCTSGSGEAAFATFLQDESGALVGYLCAKQLHPEDARDIAQEAQMRLLRYRDHAVETLRPLLYRIALNLVRDRWRQQTGPRQAAWQGQQVDADALAADGPGPELIAAQQQDLQRARRAIAGLPSHCRGVYLLNRIDGMSYSEIARHTGVSVKAVEKQISKALALLRIAVERDLPA